LWGIDPTATRISGIPAMPLELTGRTLQWKWQCSEVHKNDGEYENSYAEDSTLLYSEILWT
jgi:hypothetical protein